LITITASASTCGRTASSTVGWITISFGQSGTGDGTVGYTVQRNTSINSRTGAINIANQTVTITQAGANCTFVLEPESASVAAAGGGGSFSVSSNCSWAATTSANWISITSGSAMGDGTVTYTVAASTAGASRTGTISIGNRSFTITQAGQCLFTFNPPGAAFGAGGGMGVIAVTANTGSCERPAASGVPWITINSGQTGTGNGSVQYTVGANTASAPRTGSISIGGQEFFVQQAGAACSFNLSPPSQAAPVAGGTFNIAVATTCEWTAASSADWIIVQTGQSGTGNATVIYTVSANTSGQPRTGSILIGGQTVLIFQPAATCEVTLSPQSSNVGAAGESGSIAVDALGGCNWAASSTASWLTITSGASGAGEGFVTYTAAPHTGQQARTGAIAVGNRIFAVTQAGLACMVGLEVTSFAAAASGASSNIGVSANCAWTAAAGAGWITITAGAAGSASGTIAFSVAPNNTAEPRTGTITIAGRTFTVTQAGATCLLALTPQHLEIGGRGGAGSASVNGNGACRWQAVSGEGWIRVTWSSVSGSGVVNLSVLPNNSGLERRGRVSVGDQTLVVTQAPIAVQISEAGVLNGASFLPGPVAPGELVTIYGSGFGPQQLTPLELTEDKAGVTTYAGNTRVLFDDIPAPVIYAADGAASAVVPYGIAGRSLTTVVVEFMGVASNRLTAPVAPSAPGIFTLNASGRGQAAVLNQDGTVNGDAAPASAGSVIMIFATGGGQTSPASVDGRLSTPPLARLELPVTATLGGEEAQVLYAGPAPGLVAGVLQVNVRVARTRQPGSVPLAIRVGERESQAGVTVVIR
ncbi:MAG: hypothetical protein HYS04_17535, partial [Acidobacteria bacterium]|nr:hypothetical protein [Acidobacteriota bacterium]